MQILMVAARCYPFMGGIETHVQEVSPRLVVRGHAVDVPTTDPSGELPVEEGMRGMRVQRMPAWPKDRDFYVMLGVYAAIRRRAWDLIHFQGFNTFVVPIGLLAAVRGDLPFVLTFHSGGHSFRLRNPVRGTQHALLRPLVARAGLRELAAKGFCRSIRRDAGPGELAAAMVEELEAHREIPDLALPDWNACAQALSDVYRDVVAPRSTVHTPPGGVLPWPPATRA